MITKELLRLDLGCGPKKREGFVGVDNTYFPNVDKIFNLGKMGWPWEDGSVGEVYCSHFIEHLSGFERIDFFNELYRVLSDSGTAEIIAPYFSSPAAYGDPTHKWPPISEWTFLYLGRKWRNKNSPHIGYKCDFNAEVSVYKPVGSSFLEIKAILRKNNASD